MGAAPPPAAQLQQTPRHGLRFCHCSRLLQLNRPELPIFAIGILFTLVAGALMPSFSYMLGTVLGDLYNPNKHVVKERTAYWGLVIFILSLVRRRRERAACNSERKGR